MMSNFKKISLSLIIFYLPGIVYAQITNCDSFTDIKKKNLCNTLMKGSQTKESEFLAEARPGVPAETKTTAPTTQSTTPANATIPPQEIAEINQQPNTLQTTKEGSLPRPRWEKLKTVPVSEQLKPIKEQLSEMQQKITTVQQQTKELAPQQTQETTQSTKQDRVNIYK